MPRGSVIVHDEATDYIFDNEENLNTSKEWTADRLAERMVDVCANYGVKRPNAVVDDARGLQGETVIEMIRSTGGFWNVTKPRKGRRSEDWELINSMLQAAAEKNPVRPHLFFNERCKGLLLTLPNAIRDENDLDDWADTPHCPDHWGDSCRYLLAESQIRPGKIGRTSGMY
ncbi:MAG: hypothetical protein AAFQ64_14850 [Pseudomonadota bacterium]